MSENQDPDEPNESVRLANIKMRDSPTVPNQSPLIVHRVRCLLRLEELLRQKGGHDGIVKVITDHLDSPCGQEWINS